MEEMIESVEFRNFKALREAKLQLGRFNLIVGPNSSGKSTVFQALRALADQYNTNYESVMSVEAQGGSHPKVIINWGDEFRGWFSSREWLNPGDYARDTVIGRTDGGPVKAERSGELTRKLRQIRIYAIEGEAIFKPVPLQPNLELTMSGANFAGILDKLRDKEPERFEDLNKELSRWFPEFDRILFETPSGGTRSFLLRTAIGRQTIRATEVSQGTLFALCILALVYISDLPSLIGIEEPDRGIHPRLLREVRDALYRLSYPESFDVARPPVQVIVTTHSPFLLDLYRDHPDEVIIAEKTMGRGVRFERLSSRADLKDILGDASLGEVWYSGVLGGVPREP